MSEYPETQYAVQLVGPSELKLNKSKKVLAPAPHQVLARVEAVGLCFSDLKLLKQFTGHTRKSEVVSGIDPKVLGQISSYVPGARPGVPGHEAVCRIVAVGEGVKHHKVGERCLVQTDYRWLRTATSNAAFGYNFEGGLQEYVLMDERVIMDPESGERLLIPVSEELSSSAVCLVEPWACVEESYVNPERRTIKAGGRLLVVAEAGCGLAGVAKAFSSQGKPKQLTMFCLDQGPCHAAAKLGLPVQRAASLAELPEEGFDDIIYFGADKATIEALGEKLAALGIIAIVTGGRKIGSSVSVGVGRVHYGMKRWVGTASSSAADAYATIPETGEIRPGEKILVMGAAGPMGQMHVIRDLCAGAANVEIVGTDLDEQRLAALAEKAEPMAKANGAKLRLLNPKKQPLAESFSYVALMVPVGAMVADAVNISGDRCLINIFAGVPADTKVPLDMDKYIANHCFMFGTSGSVIRDMKIVLSKMEAARLDTNCSVGAISGMAGALDGLAAVENRTLGGKIIVYPALHELPLIPLTELVDKLPSVAEKLDRGGWCKAAEQELLRVAR